LAVSKEFGFTCELANRAIPNNSPQIPVRWDVRLSLAGIQSGRLKN
jgi:hypothetical protein